MRLTCGYDGTNESGRRSARRELLHLPNALVIAPWMPNDKEIAKHSVCFSDEVLSHLIILAL
jgi:hypothetical protein